LREHTTKVTRCWLQSSLQENRAEFHKPDQTWFMSLTP